MDADVEKEKVEPADSEQDEEEDVYEVERIIDMRVEAGEVLYRVRWKNYCSDDDTWEPEAHLEDCREVLLNYKKNNAEIKMMMKDVEPKKEVKLPTRTDVPVADSDNEGAAPLEEDLSDEPSGRSEDKAKQKKGQRSELKLQSFKDLLHDRRTRKTEASAGPSQKEASLQKTKSQNSKLREDPAPHSSDSSDSSSLQKKTRSKATPEGTPPPPASREEEAGGKELESTPGGQKEGTGSTNLFEKFLLNCEAKDRVPRRHAVHQPPVPAETSSSSTGKTPKVQGKIEKKGKSTKDSPAQKPDADKMATKQTEAPRASQSHGFSLDSDEKEVEDPAPRPRMGEDRRDKGEEMQRPGWERKAPTEDRRWKRREDSEPRLFMACEDTPDPQDPLEGADKSRGQATLSLGMDLNLDWMTLEDFQKHLNGEDEILSGPPLSPSELRDAVKSGDYMSVKLALNSKEEYNLDQEV
ncbi:hypothetical protein NHX12_007783, partial [Muraenolepis orangiensis]